MEVTKELLEAELAKVRAGYDAQAADFNAAKKLGIAEGQIGILQNLIKFMAQPEPEAVPAADPDLKIAEDEDGQ